MKPYSFSVVSLEDLNLFFNIRKIIEEMPELDLGEDGKGEKVLVSCHMLCRAIARFFPEIEYRDGYFRNYGHEHSWLVITETGLIVDIYPIGAIGGPILLDTKCLYESLVALV